MNSKLTPIQFIYLLLACSAGVGIVLYSTAVFGAGIGPDPVGYLAMARSLAAGAGQVDHTAVVVNYQPGLYPLLLAAISLLTGLDPLRFLNLVNAALFGVIIFQAGVMLFRGLYPRKAAACLAVAWVVLSSPLYQVCIHAWSEPLFIVLTLLFLLLFSYYLENPRFGTLLAAAIAAGLACLARYAGVAGILCGGLLVLLSGVGPLRKKIAHALAFGFLSGLPLALWLARNISLTGSAVGAEIRRQTGLTLVDNLHATALTAVSWLVPNRLIEERGWLAFLLAGVFVLWLIWLMILVVRKSGTAAGLVRLQPALAPGLFSLVYILFLLYSASKANTSLVDDRFMAPVYVPMLVTALVFISTAAGLPSMPLRRKLANTALLAVLAAGLAYPALETWNYTTLYHREGLDFTGKAWVESDMLASLRAHPSGTDNIIFTNGPDLYYLYFYQPGDRLPLTRSYFSPNTLENTDLPAGQKVTLAWFDGLHHAPQPDLQALSRHFTVTGVEEYKEGKLYDLIVEP